MVIVIVTSLLLISLVWPIAQSALTINVTPSHYNIGLTKSLKVECLFSRDTTSSLTFLMSLSLSHSTSTENPEYEDLVSTNNFETQVYGNADKPNKTEVYGAINENNTSYLRVIWKFPNASRTGGYKCDAIGLNRKRKPLTLSNTVKVTAVYIDSERLLDELLKLTEIAESQNNTIELKTKQLEERIQTNADNVGKNQMNFSKFSVMTMTTMRSSMFIPSPVFNGRRYWMTTRPLYINVTEMENFCEYFGGYLAEIDSVEEYRIIVDNLLGRVSFQYVHISGTDEEQEGVWRYHHSKNVMKFLNWASGDPTGTRAENCLAYATTKALVDVSCSIYKAANLGVICEIPE